MSAASDKLYGRQGGRFVSDRRCVVRECGARARYGSLYCALDHEAVVGRPPEPQPAPAGDGWLQLDFGMLDDEAPA